jgi:hypothetical protein
MFAGSGAVGIEGGIEQPMDTIFDGPVGNAMSPRKSVL